MIALFTDFGLAGPYMGQMRAVLVEQAPGIPIVDLMADAPRFNPRASAYLLAACSAGFPDGTIFLCVVDPGVGSARRPVALKAGGMWFVGPDNGLMSIVARQRGCSIAIELPEPQGPVAPTFHGRDLFAPAAARLATGESPEGKQVEAQEIDRADWPDDLPEVVYIDSYGNVITGIRAKRCSFGAVIEWQGRRVVPARTFNDVAPGEAIYYANSSGLLEIAVREGSAAELFSASVGSPVGQDVE